MIWLATLIGVLLGAGVGVVWAVRTSDSPDSKNWGR